MAGRALRPSLPPPLLLLLLLLPLCRPAAAAVPHRVTNVTASHVFPADLGLWQPPMAVLPAWQQPPAASPPQTRFFLFFEYLTPRLRYIPGLAKNSRCCGRENIIGKIAGGTAASPNQYPWMAAFVLTGLNTPFCGGSLMNNKYVLTAASCMVSLTIVQIQVILGRHFTAMISVNELLLPVLQITSHPEYNPATHENNIALVKLVTPLTLPILGNLIAPICMPHNSVDRYTNKAVVASGWGVTSDGGTAPVQLHTVTLRTISNRRCESLMGDQLTIRKTMICAGPDYLPGGGKGTCLGDSGGPLSVRTWYSSDQRSLVGITNFGIGCGQPNRPGVYTRVTSFLDWLIDNMPDAFYC